jgi:hypothetical protein
MAGQAPWQKKNKKKKETAAVATSTPPTPSTTSLVSPPPIAAYAMHVRDLSCASIEELLDEVLDDDVSANAQALSTILDSGTTSTLISDQAMFWTYSTQDPVVVKTANHGSLHTSG